mmetsp:Transcript_22423/g.46888  ORF Transcript_22423/g.46888 Transcript_22423/m.46888 type:complete len:82 (+) Transcript_22423:1001-1246(+)
MPQKISQMPNIAPKKFTFNFPRVIAGPYLISSLSPTSPLNDPSGESAADAEYKREEHVDEHNILRTSVGSIIDEDDAGAYR